MIVKVGNNNIELLKKDIAYISQFVRYPFTKRFLIKIVLNRRTLGIHESYIVMTEPQYDFMNTFAHIGIILKNTP